MRLNLREIIEIPGGSVPFSQELDTALLDFPSVRAYTAPITAEGKVVNTAGILTLQEVKRACWKDAQRLKNLHGPDVFCTWARQIEAFAGGVEVLQNTLMQLTSVYLDYAVGYLTKDSAKRLFGELEVKMEALLAEYRPVQQTFDNRGTRRAS